MTRHLITAGNFHPMQWHTERQVWQVTGTR